MRRIIVARDQVALLAPWREAAVNQDLVDRLHGEFHAWRKTQPKRTPRNWDGMIGGLNEWTNIEKFLKDQYPAAHRGLGAGYEMAGPLLDGRPMQSDYMMPGPLEYSTPQPYETGPEAEAQHGYDPKEIAAGMLLLHNKSDRFRGDMSHEDQARLTDIAQKRFQMQRDYEQRQTTAATDPQGITGVNINDDYQDYTGQILRGEKTIETRDTPTLHHAVGQRIALISTRHRPRRPALVVGYATIGDPVFYPDADAFDADYDRHLVGRDSPHHITSPTNKTGTKYGYPMLEVEDAEPFPAPRGGIVTRKNMQFGDR